MDSWRTVLLPAAADPVHELALGVELRVRESAAAAHWGARRVRVATARDLTGDDPGAELLVGLRPLARREQTAAWARSGVSWDLLRRGGGAFARAQREWFVELYGIAHDARLLAGLRDDSDWVTLDAVTSPLVWAHLDAASAREIPIVPAGKGQTVRMAAQATAAVRVRSESRGALRLEAEIAVGETVLDPRTVHPVGRTGFYAARAERSGIHLTLAAADLGEGVCALLSAPGGVTVPAADVRDFAREALPRLGRQNTVLLGPGVVLPEPDPTTLVVTVAFGEGDALTYRLEWVREGSDREPCGAVREGDLVERDLRAAVAEAWSRAPDIAFAPSAELDGVDAAEFAALILPAVEEGDHVRVETRGRRREYRELRGDPRITVKTVESAEPDWFDLGVLVEIDGRSIPFTPLFTALALRKKKLLLLDGSYFSLAHPALDRLRDLIDEATELAEWETGPRVSRYQVPLWEAFEDLADEAQPAVAWRAAVEALRASAPSARTPVPRALTAQLRPYQQEGFDRLALWWRHRVGGILADDMGLGKTLQVLALLAHARETGERRPFLVVAPTSVMDTWRAEAARFTPDVRVHVQDATLRKARTRLEDIDAEVIVTSYGLLRLDEDAYAARSWALVVLDEAQFVKNPATGQHRAVQRLRADTVIAVTGTPLENSLTELWALLSLTCPGLFASARRFREDYVKPIERGKVPENEEGSSYRAARLARLRSRLRPFVLRRTKERVAPELPPRQEQELRIELSAAHRAVYDTVLQRERQKVLGLLDDLDRNRFIVFRSLTLLRRLALSPLLVDAVDADEARSRGIRSAKLDALRERLVELAAEGHRALVFSQFTSFLDLVRADLDAHHIAYSSLDGSTRRRAEVVDGFRDGDAPVFLISLKAGGFGLTLTEADYVFLLDPWWNPAAEAQAVDRTHRIGQTRPVTVYRLIASGTIEEKVLALQQRKARLFRAVVGDDDALARALTAEDIRGLLEP
ncbi:MAG: DEAD/DEAH box helicase [Microbacterium sp.]|uniref:DEAD/DEAH box helicase n=1 Tax=Microbacterium sp. TaxID=51671 RepID=UPI001ACA769B|nr:DEAD/DEAH box helicase [Microbacterium sp.]MBN9177254.1 DEAD/DEAH box helicase [Microbacterium sp.]